MNIQLLIGSCICGFALYGILSILPSGDIELTFHQQVKYLAHAKISFLIAGILVVPFILLVIVNAEGYRLGENWIQETIFIFLFLFIFPVISFVCQELEWRCSEKSQRN